MKVLWVREMIDVTATGHVGANQDAGRTGRGDKAKLSCYGLPKF